MRWISLRRSRRKMDPFSIPKEKRKQQCKSATKTKESILVKRTSFMSMVFCASARTTTSLLLLIEDRDWRWCINFETKFTFVGFCTTSFPFPPLDDDIVVVVVVVVNELAAANIVFVVVVVLSVVVVCVCKCALWWKKSLPEGGQRDKKNIS